MNHCKIRIKATGEVLAAKWSPWGWLAANGLSFSDGEVEVVNTRADQLVGAVFFVLCGMFGFY